MKLAVLRKCIISVFLVVVILTAQVPQVFAVEGPMNRDNVEEKYKWKLEDMYRNTDDFNLDYKKVQDEYIPAIKNFQGSLSNASKVLDCLKLYEKMMTFVEKLYVYSHLKIDENQADSAASELSSRTEALYSESWAAASFIQPELLEQPESIIRGYIENTLMADYKEYFEAILKFKAHTLSKEGEELLAMTSEITGFPYEVYTKITTADMVLPKIIDDGGEEIQLSQGVYASALESSDREYRKRAFEEMYGAYKKSINSIASALNAQVRTDIFYAKARKYSSSLEASLAAEDIPQSVYDNLIDAVNNNLGYLQKYVGLRKKVLGVDKVHQYDMYVPLVSGYNPEISYEDAQEMVIDGLSPLGSEYQNMLRTGFDNRWIDAFETENKATGGYTWGAYGTHPYVLLNYSGSTGDVLTMAHEMGHAMNTYYTNNSQSYMKSQIPVFTAEIASTTNEVLMLKYLIKNASNDDEKLYYLNQLAEQIRGSVYTQVMYSEFEKAIHERVENGEALSVSTFNEIWGGLMTKYFGKDFEVDELAQLWWARIPHFYMNFYVYKYATSMAASDEIARNLINGRNVGKYMEFLKSGSALQPIDTINMVGVDMNSPQAVNNLLKEFGDLVNQMQVILDRKARAICIK